MECRERTGGEQRAHLAAIADIVARWQDGEIGMVRKRELIARENAFYHGRVTRGRTGDLLTGDTAERLHLAPPEPEPAEEPADFWWQDR